MIGKRITETILKVRNRLLPYGPIFTASLAGGVFVAACLPYTVYLQKVRDIIRVPVPLTNRDQRLVDEVKADLIKQGLEEKEVNNVEVFYRDNFGSLEPWLVSNMYSSNGALIALPHSLSYEATHEMMIVKIGIYEIDPDTPEVDELYQYSLLDEGMKRFLIAKCFHQIKSQYQTFIRAALLSSSVLLTYAVGLALNMAYKRTFGQSTTYLLLYPFCLYIALTILDRYNLKVEGEANIAAGKMGKHYAEGGFQYYTQIMERNKRMRLFMGKYKDYVYTAMGNRKFRLWRLCQLPYTKSRETLEELLTDYYSENVSK